MTRWITKTLGQALVLLVGLALAGSMASFQARAGGTLVYGMPADHDILDPHATGGWIT